MTYFVDIDGTICNNTDGKYDEAVPYKKRIEKINRLYDEGHTIIFWTARGATTGIDWAELTQRQLNEWGVKHHELKMGKPYYDLFIDDRNINAEEYFVDIS